MGLECPGRGGLCRGVAGVCVGGGSRCGGRGGAGQGGLLPCRFHPAVSVLAFQGGRGEQAGQLLQKKCRRVLQILEGNFLFPVPPAPPGLGCADADDLGQ